MLVLSRKVDQEIVIGGNIKVRVLSIKGNTIRIGIEAPPEVPIVRSELLEQDSQPASGIPDLTGVDSNFSFMFETAESV